MKPWQEFWNVLAQTGWLTDLGNERARDLEAALEGHDGGDLEHLWTHLADLRFDVECVFGPEEGEPGPYTRILKQYAAASRDLFHPEDVRDQLDGAERVAHVSFRHEGREYACAVPWHDDFFREEVHDLVNRALADAGVEQRFGALPADESGDLLLALVRPEVLRRARDLGLLPESDLEDLERSIAEGAAQAETELFGDEL